MPVDSTGQADGGQSSNPSPTHVPSAPTSDSGNPSGTTTATPVPTGQPAQQHSDGRFVSNEELGKYERWKQQADGARQNFDRVKELGYETFDDSLSDLARFKKYQSDPHVSRVLEALESAGAQPTGHDPRANPESQTITAESIDKRVNEILSERDQSVRHQQFLDAQRAESNLIEQTIRTDTFKSIFGEHSYLDALDGKGGEAAQAYASILDNAIYSAAPKDQDGRAMPVTDPTEFNRIQEKVKSMVNAMKAHAIMATSGSLGDVPLKQNHVSEPGQYNPDSEREERSRRAGEFMRQRMTELTGEGLPASQQA